jgi:hypothetical protein
MDRIISHSKGTLVAIKPPPPHIAYQEVLMAAEMRERIQENSYSTEKRREPASTESPALGMIFVIVPD